MISSKKLKIFISYNGDVDAFQRGKKSDKCEMEDAEYFFLNSLVQDFILIKNKEASTEFENKAEEKLRLNSDSENTVKEFKEFVYGRL
jgi:hypothetical protein